MGECFCRVYSTVLYSASKLGNSNFAGFLVCVCVYIYIYALHI